MTYMYDVFVGSLMKFVPCLYADFSTMLRRILERRDVEQRGGSSGLRGRQHVDEGGEIDTELHENCE